MNYKYGVTFLALFLLFFPFNANADSVTISADLPIYTNADVITIHGVITTETTLQISIFGFDDEIVTEEVIIILPTDFSHNIILSDYDLEKSGIYVISVRYDDTHLESEFFYDSGYNVNPMDINNNPSTISESDQLIVFSISVIVIIGMVIFLARHSIIRKKTEYDTGEWNSKKNRDYEKYHSEWMSDEVNFTRDGKKKLTDEEFRKSLLSSNLPNYYEILEIKNNATQSEIKNQYRHLAKKWHPDREKSPDAEKKMAQINTAYEVLSNSKRRKMYDQHFSK
ncbi:Chaperone protein DnaJ [Marine Group I thaumarchaeote SCGC AAA799-D07]|nr:Chaperone protein DnaJ [Marine Group I thaumarchaeote SCGC AAA799-D07]